jgi:hypothetical protein
MILAQKRAPWRKRKKNPRKPTSAMVVMSGVMSWQDNRSANLEWQGHLNSYPWRTNQSLQFKKNLETTQTNSELVCGCEKLLSDTYIEYSITDDKASHTVAIDNGYFSCSCGDATKVVNRKKGPPVSRMHCTHMHLNIYRLKADSPLIRQVWLTNEETRKIIGERKVQRNSYSTAYTIYQGFFDDADIRGSSVLTPTLTRTPIGSPAHTPAPPLSSATRVRAASEEARKCSEWRPCISRTSTG